jgi:hypothetical protein
MVVCPGGFEMLGAVPTRRTTRVNGFLMDCSLAGAILQAVANHEPGKSHPGTRPNDAALAQEIELLAGSGHTQNTSRELAACLKQTPEALDYLARRIFEAK